MTAFVQTDHAGRIEVEPAVSNDSVPCVIVRSMGIDILEVMPQEARRLAVKIIEAASQAERGEDTSWP